MDWHRQIDGYCERMGPEFWAEPWNAVTNAAFIIAAIVVLLAAIRRDRLDGPVIWLIALIGLIGIGSFLFHTYATVWAVLMDTTPIMLFILSFFTISMNRFGGYGWGRSLLLTLGFIVALVAVSWVLRQVLFDLIGGTVSYVPAWLGLLGVGFWLKARAHPAGNWLLGVAMVFAASMLFRALDSHEHLCESFPIGTHILWHILNGVVLGALALAVVRHGRAPSRT